MKTIEYEDFALQIETSGEASFKVRTIRSPYAGGEGVFHLPFSASEIPDVLAALENVVWRSGPSDSRSRYRDIRPSPEVPPARSFGVEEVGEALFRTLFSDLILESYLLSRGSVEARENRGLRLRLIIDPTVPQLVPICSLPWEILYRSKRREFFSRNPLTPLVRHFDVTQPAHLPALDSGLRVLVAMANPRGTQPLDFGEERRWIMDAWGKHSSVEVVFLEHASLRSTHIQLRDSDFHVLHFIGHAHSSNEGGGVLLFETQQGNAEPVSGDILAEHLKPMRSIRLVFLNACETARLPRSGNRDPYTGIASALVLKGMPAVIAMQFPIPDKAAVAFSDGLYSALAAGLPIEAAVAEGRLSILRSFPSSLSWATPVLFSSIPEGRLFSPPIETYALDINNKVRIAEDTAPPLPMRSEEISDHIVGRAKETSRLMSLLETEDTGRPRLEVWRSQPASGVSYFFRQSCRILHNKGIILYVDCASQEQNAVFAQIVLALYNYYSKAWASFQKFLVARSGNRLSLTHAGLSNIPHVGTFLTQITQGVASQFEQSNFPSAVAEIVCDFLRILTTEAKVLVLVDNAQEIDDWSLDLLKTTTGSPYQKLHYVLAFVERDERRIRDATEFLCPEWDAAYDLVHLNFPQPDVKFIAGLAESMGAEVPLSDAETIVKETDSNIYKILAALRQLCAGSSRSLQSYPEFEILSALEREIIQILAVASQAIRRSDILALCLGSQLVLVAHDYEVDLALGHLAELGLATSIELPDGDSLVSLTISLESIGIDSGSAVPKLVTADRLYSYFSRAMEFSRRHSASELAILLYRLSKLVAPEATPRLVQRILALSLQMGSIDAAERFISKAAPGVEKEIDNYEDYLVRAVFYLSTRSYQKALRLLDRPAENNWSKHRIINVLRAIALNRTRYHEAADRLLDGLLRTSKSLEEMVLLAAYKVAGYLHMNNVEGARQFAGAYQSQLKEAENFGYFLRNSASAFSSREGFVMLSEAVQRFEATGDRFGYATTLSNQAMCLFYLGDIEKAHSIAKEAYELLEIFGIHHLHVVTTNLGLINMKMSRFEDAEKLLWRAVSISRTRMPIIYQKVNLAVLFALSHREAEALRLIRDLREEVEAHPVDRVRQKYYLNSALISAHCSTDSHEILSLCQKALLHPDRKNKMMTQRRIGTIQMRLADGQTLDKDELLEMFSPCSLSYWYQNPIEALPTDILSSKAVI